MTRLYLVRHGRTALNAAGALRGRLDPPLDDVGRREAEHVAAFVAGSPGPVVAVVSSPLRRATETAGAIAARVGRPVDVDPDLVDRDYGEWAGHSRQAVVARWGSVDTAPGVEDLARVTARSRRALDAAGSRGGDHAAVVAVAHDVVNRMLLADLDPSLGPPDALPQPTGCCNVLEWVEGRWSVVAVGFVPGAEGDGAPGA